MAVQMTVTVSDWVYDQVKRLAYSQQQPLSEVVDRLLLYSLPISDEAVDGSLSESEKALKQEIAAYQRMHSTLWKKYPNQHVALYMGKLVDYDTDGVALSLRIYQRYPDQTVLIRQVEPTPEREIRIRSPRFVRSTVSL